MTKTLRKNLVAYYNEEICTLRSQLVRQSATLSYSECKAMVQKVNELVLVIQLLFKN